ncbi:MAG: 3-methyl-adenine glycosylase [Rubritepida sp.]|nr:3-methyl-adenine glycosylase [Rubritepida sp.]
MRRFATIFALAAGRKGGEAALEVLLAETAPRSPAEIAATPDDRLLAEMTWRIFCAGFSSQAIEGKWPGFEAAFDRRPARLRLHERCALRRADQGTIRNGAKIRSVQVNAAFLVDLAEKHGSAARFFADWPDSDHVGLLDLLKKRASHLGGDSAGRFLRVIGKPAFIARPDVVAALIREGVLERPPGGKRDLAAIQAAFNRWAAESGRDLTSISRVLAMSIGEQGHGAPH